MANRTDLHARTVQVAKRVGERGQGGYITCDSVCSRSGMASIR